MSNVKPEKLALFLQDKLKPSLEVYQTALQKLNEEIAEYTQLKHSITVIRDDLGKSFKTQVNIGGDFFIQAKVPDTEKILVNVGCNVYVEFTLDEAAKYAQMKINILEKEAEVVRDELCKTKAHIKMTLLLLGEQTGLHAGIGES